MGDKSKRVTEPYANWAEQTINPRPHPCGALNKRMNAARLVRESIRDLAKLGWTDEEITPLTPYTKKKVGTIIAAWRRCGETIPYDDQRQGQRKQFELDV